jgi:hypothetical protein
MSVRVYLHRFTRKFIFDVLPGALASLVGALFFAHQWTQVPMRTEVARVTAQNEQIVTMMREEQSLMRAVLERDHDAAPRQPTAAKDTPALKDKSKVDADKVETSRGDAGRVETGRAETTASVPARRRTEPSREVARTAAAPATAAPAAAVPAVVAPIVPPPAVPPVAEAPATALVSGPLVAPDPEDGVITRIVSVVAALTHRTMEVGGVHPVTAFAPTPPAISQFDAWPSGHVLDATR